MTRLLFELGYLGLSVLAVCLLLWLTSRSPS
jgi:hypothetical protein